MTIEEMIVSDAEKLLQTKFLYNKEPNVYLSKNDKYILIIHRGVGKIHRIEKYDVIETAYKFDYKEKYLEELSLAKNDPYLKEKLVKATVKNVVNTMYKDF